MSNILMKCGHTVQGVLKQEGGDIPACVICLGINPGATTPAKTKPDLTGRIAYCICGSQRPSSLDLAFFELGRWKAGTHRENEDTFYCGCRGWD